ncbi:hypothetical protein F0L74_11910 [Chitinophaga agrisoli]|uniref:Zinc finger CGNR domain-containing protein n=1 Tax=Chitinophaga agrisoli TaxID=2607653 RepID=A0A5B2VTU4_9BACT|nr:ABATE domain-containing protein [Chitinophaga agrisoli]KAA2243213.1 hypothetical protein F0L74_11910 [Chitinophaga agrisoli]
MSKERNIANLPLDGGALCFHFINTVDSWRDEPRHEYLDSYATVLEWSHKVNILTTKRIADLRQYAAGHPGAAAAALEQLKQVRETLYRFFSALAEGETAALPAAELQAFNTALAAGLSRIRFTIKAATPQKGAHLQKDQYPQQSWLEEDTDLLAPLWVVMKSAYDVLTMEDPERIKTCGACGWMFLDQTKNNKRRWCNLTCGSIEKSKKYYQSRKHKEAEH